MKIVVIGGAGLIGSKLVTEGLADVLQGASVVVDVSNSPSEDAAVFEFFETSTRNLLAAEAEAGVGHHVALSVVGTQRLAGSGYFRAKIAQEELITGSDSPYSIVHATQFFEFLPALADMHAVGDTVRVPSVLFQPMAANDVAAAVGRVAVGPPVNGIVEVGGPEAFRLDDLIRRDLASRHDPRAVVVDAEAGYSGARVEELTLVPGAGAALGTTSYEDWARSRSMA